MIERRIILGGERVALAEMTEEDQPIFHRWRLENPELLRLVGDHGASTLEAQYGWFERSQEPDRRMFSIVTAESWELIGHGGLVDIDRQEKTAQLRTTIGNSAYWGKGYGTEATRLIARFGFTELGLSSIWLRVAPENARARKSYLKAGFREEGREEWKGEEFLRMRLRTTK